MARIIDAEKLLSLFARRYEQKSFSVIVSDELLPHNNVTFSVSEGKVLTNDSLIQPSFRLNIRELAQLLLGYHTSEKEEPFRLIFPEKTPQMNFMME